MRCCSLSLSLAPSSAAALISSLTSSRNSGWEIQNFQPCLGLPQGLRTEKHCSVLACIHQSDFQSESVITALGNPHLHLPSSTAGFQVGNAHPWEPCLLKSLKSRKPIKQNYSNFLSEVYLPFWPPQSLNLSLPLMSGHSVAHQTAGGSLSTPGNTRLLVAWMYLRKKSLQKPGSLFIPCACHRHK